MLAPLRHARTIVAIIDRAAVRASDRDTSDLPHDAHARGLTGRFYATSRSMLKVAMDRACGG
jgi:hypothetical protein